LRHEATFLKCTKKPRQPGLFYLVLKHFFNAEAQSLFVGAALTANAMCINASNSRLKPLLLLSLPLRLLSSQKPEKYEIR
jgi:hypothetical protein